MTYPSSTTTTVHRVIEITVLHKTYDGFCATEITLTDIAGGKFVFDAFSDKPLDITTLPDWPAQTAAQSVEVTA